MKEVPNAFDVIQQLNDKLMKGKLYARGFGSLCQAVLETSGIF